MTALSAEQLWTGSDPAPWAVSDEIVEADVVVVGTGAGGATAAWALRDSGARVLLLEQGDWLPRELQNWDPKAVFGDRRYKVTEEWVDDIGGTTFHPGLHDVVGGNTKVFGAAFPRFRESDFTAVEHIDGTSPAWPLSYADLEPYYEQAEQLFGVRGDDGDDPSAPPRRRPYPYPAVPDEPYVADLAQRLRTQGLHPSPVPLGIDLGPGGTCLRCRTCDGYPCMVGAKNDAERAAVRPALASPTIRLLRNTQVQRIDVVPGGRAVAGLTCLHHGRPLRVRTNRVVLACGSARTALLLLRSTSDGHEQGLGNATDQVGRNYMQHVNSALLAVDPLRSNPVFFQKTVQVNDWYDRGAGGSPYPWGNVQALGKLQADQLKPSRPRIPHAVLDQLAKHSVEWWVMSEDLPRPEHRVRLRPDGRVGVTWRPTNLSTHKQLLSAFASAMRRAGYPLVFHETLDIATNSHMCGTAVMGTDPRTSVLDPSCRSHDVENLWLVDSSCFPSSAALNPALTIAANALRVADEGGLTA